MKKYNKIAFSFAKIKRYDFDFPPYWVAVLDTLQRVFRYLEEVKSVELYKSLKRLKEIANNKQPYHLSNIEFCVDATIESADINGEIRNNIFDDMTILGGKFNTPYIRAFLDHGTIYVGKEGGFFIAKFVEHEIVEKKETDNFEFPIIAEAGKPEIRIFQWAGSGTHYYAKVNNIDVVIDGEQKWNTWNEAQKATEKFIKFKL